MEEALFITVLLDAFAFLLGIIGAIVVIYGAYRAFFTLLHRLLHQDHRKFVYIDLIRSELGHYLVLALEFMIARDILRTLVETSWDDLARLTMLILLRTVLDYFLNREIALLSHRSSEK